MSIFTCFLVKFAYLFLHMWSLNFKLRIEEISFSADTVLVDGITGKLEFFDFVTVADKYIVQSTNVRPTCIGYCRSKLKLCVFMH